ncbi:MAG: DUF1295 domain-containing protein [Gammaproteobacteria bacterium]|nr:DUF1295 domain-containing protein [Gammaproteobacteria bacterium]NNF61304.1 DUF1295 domain-containing protein [Gammaproteobacteria bacterium]NNM20862.1 DUF1295 domain-containing protein [Gammaproteobacteria bacterium]
MLDWNAYGFAVAAVVAAALLAWVASLFRNDVSIVDTLWGLFFLLALSVYQYFADSIGARATIVLVLVAVWSLRLALYIGVRNHGEPEDARYRAMREKNDPGFRYKSIYIVFGLQAALASIIALPLLAAAQGNAPLNLFDYAGIALWLIGFFFEAVGDAQLARFKSDPSNRGKVLDTGLWRLTRHPNYFGEATLWWGYFCLAVAAGGWWTFFSPIIMTFFLLKVSGVALLEKGLSETKPQYADYIRRTNAFFPGPPQETN